jgi:uncharacterized protein (DUF1800 family)
MGRKFPALAWIVAFAAAMAISLVAASADSGDARFVLTKIPKEERILHALNRLTFGPRPGDVATVQAMGLEKWIDLQLHPDQIPENPALAEKLKMLDTLGMSSEQIVENYPPAQLVRQMIAGRIPFPSDPDRRLVIQKLAARLENRQGQDNANAPRREPIQNVLTPEQIRSLRTATTNEERLALFQSLPEDKQDAIIEGMPMVRNSLALNGPPELRRRIELTAGAQQVVARDLMEGKLYRAVYSNRQLEEVLVDFWYNHFNVFLDKGADHFLVTSYERDVIRPHVLGKFGDLLEATAKSPAMLFYLDNWQSVGADSRAARRNLVDNPRAQRRGLNENYGRELMELHTLGVDSGYTQKDVTEVARCFTGWTIQQPQLGGTFLFNPRMHDYGEKVVLGVRIPAGGGIEDGEKVLDILARHPSTARHISKELATRFVADHPPDELVDRMAAMFLKTGGDIREVLKTMFASREFWSQGAYRTKMKSPLEMVASAVRAVNGDVQNAQALANQVAQMGEPLYRKIEPTGYSNPSEQWANSAGLLARMNFAVGLAENKIPGVKVDLAEAAQPEDPMAGISIGSPEFQKR